MPATTPAVKPGITATGTHPRHARTCSGSLLRPHSYSDAPDPREPDPLTSSTARGVKRHLRFVAWRRGSRPPKTARTRSGQLAAIGRWRRYDFVDGAVAPESGMTILTISYNKKVKTGSGT